MSSQLRTYNNQQSRETWSGQEKQVNTCYLPNENKSTQLKHPTPHQTQLSYHHHPYNQRSTNLLSHMHANVQSTSKSFAPYVLNQNSNFSVASSSTGGGTASSHAPTAQSNTTGSSLSPPSTNNTIKSSAIDSGNNSKLNIIIRSNTKINSKKLKTEPVLSYIHQSERLKFANTHISWNEEQWKRVVFQDERKFNLDGPDGFAFYFHDLRNHERSLTQRPRGYSVYVYGIVTSGGPIHLEVSPVKLPISVCVETILREKRNILAKLGGNNDFILQDNWSPNLLPNVQDWLSTEGIKNQAWPTISHDINIMENIWGWLIREVYDCGRKFCRKDDLIFRIKETWDRIPTDLLANLYSTMPERITELYYTRGAYTNC